ncbi:ASCH/PUA domain-containing protein [Listeria ilorinensis]|uniref:ASCH/PUA domain-containing protein n=1 Tax=Listeria ilorinensis TaxID=2867439 RepID=UPI001EF59A0D|nr:ASCH/PUA domain-containing protein [Listeria ilorinensis]
MYKTHELKILPWFFEPVRAGDKPFEIRKNDRDFKIGDSLLLCEWTALKYTGEFLVARITFITNYAQQDDYVVMGIEVLEDKNIQENV